MRPKVRTSLSWKTIQSRFSGEWVELSDVEWPQESAYPLRARVVHNSPERSTLSYHSDAIIFYITPILSYIEHSEGESSGHRFL